MIAHAGPAARVSGFMAHLRRHGFLDGPAETELVLSVLAAEEFPEATAVRLALKTLLSGNREQWARFDELFDNYWFGRGLRVVAPTQAEAGVRNRGSRPEIWDKGPDGRGTGRLIASRSDAHTRTDLRMLVTPDEMAEAERIAERLAHAIRYRPAAGVYRPGAARPSISDGPSGATCRAAASRSSCGASIARNGRLSSLCCSTPPDRWRSTAGTSSISCAA